MFKKVFLILIVFLSFNSKILAKEKVALSRCIDGDTIEVLLNNEKVKVRFLAIDTNEIAHGAKLAEPYGIEASEYTCNILKNSSLIELEQDSNSSKYDKYNRYLAWVFVDSKLLQDLLVQNGLAEVKYLYGDYKYTSILKQSELIAKNNKVGIWSEPKTDYNYLIYIIIILFIIPLLKFSIKSIKI